MSSERLQAALADLENGGWPAPPPELVFVGDGDYLKIGAEFLRYFVEPGGLAPDHSVLDLGSGIGRMAAGLSRYLDPAKGSYTGFDPVEAGVAWCKQTYADQPNFRFEWADIYNEFYRPGGTILAMDYVFPCDDASIDFAIATSVFTHLYEREIAAYFGELARVLRPGGRVFSTAYLYEGDEPMKGHGPHLQFNQIDPDYPYRWHVDGMPPLSAVCYSEDYFSLLIERQTGRRPEIHRGRWRGGKGPWFQDLVLL
jgi:SAM-dependent methyltransferase